MTSPTRSRRPTRSTPSCAICARAIRKPARCRRRNARRRRRKPPRTTTLADGPPPQRPPSGRHALVPSSHVPSRSGACMRFPPLRQGAGILAQAGCRRMSDLKTISTDVVGSLLRPAALKDARTRFDDGKISADELRAIEDEAVRDAVRAAGSCRPGRGHRRRDAPAQFPGQFRRRGRGLSTRAARR